MTSRRPPSSKCATRARPSSRAPRAPVSYSRLANHIVLLWQHGDYQHELPPLSFFHALVRQARRPLVTINSLIGFVIDEHPIQYMNRPKFTSPYSVAQPGGEVVKTSIIRVLWEGGSQCRYEIVFRRHFGLSYERSPGQCCRLQVSPALNITVTCCSCSHVADTDPNCVLHRYPVSVCVDSGGSLRVGAEIASEGLKGRVFEFSLGDLNNDEDQVSLMMLLLSTSFVMVKVHCKICRQLV